MSSSPRLRARAAGLTTTAALAALASVGASNAAAVDFATPPSVKATIPVSIGQSLYQSAYDAKTGLLYVADPKAGLVHVVYTTQATRASTGGAYATASRAGGVRDPAFNSVVQRIDVSDAPVYGLDLDADTHRVLGTATTKDRLVVIAGNDGTAAGGKATRIETTSLPGHTRDVRIDEDNHLGYVAQYSDDAVAVVSGATGRTTRVFAELADAGHPDAAEPAGLEVNSEQDVVYTANLTGGPDGRGTVSVLDQATGAVRQVVDAGVNTSSVAYSARFDRLYAVNQGPDGATGSVTTYAVDRADGTLTELRTTPTGEGALGAAVDEHNGLVYSTSYGRRNPAANTVAVLDARTGEAIRDVTVGTKPLFTVVDPVSHTAWVTNQKDGTLSVLNGPAPRPETVNGAQVTVGAAPVAAGASVPVSGTGFGAGQAVSVKLDDAGAVIATFTADGSGAFSGSVAIPASATPGVRHVLRFLGLAAGEITSRSLVGFVDLSGTTTTTSVGGPVSLKLTPSLYQSAYNPGTGLLYVADAGSGMVHVVYTEQATRASTGGRYTVTPRGGGATTDPEPNTVVGKINTPDTPIQGLGIDTRTNTIYGVSTRELKLVLIDGFTDRVRKTAPLPAQARDVRVDKSSGRAYISAVNDDAIVEVDGATGATLRTLSVRDGSMAPGARTAGLTLNLDDGVIYAANLAGGPNGNGSVSVIDIATGQVRQVVDGGGGSTTTVDYDPRSRRAFATSQGTAPGSGGVTTFAVGEQGRLTTVATTPTTVGALGATVDSAGGYLYSTDFRAEPGTVSLIAASTGERIGSVGVGLRPLFTTVAADSRTAYVTNQTASSLSVIAGGTLAGEPVRSGGAAPAPAPAAPSGGVAGKQQRVGKRARHKRSRVSLRLSRATIARGSRVRARIAVSAGGKRPLGSVVVRVDGRWKRTARLKRGTITVTIKGLKPGRHRVTAAYAGSRTVARSTSPKRTVRVKR